MHFIGVFKMEHKVLLEKLTKKVPASLSSIDSEVKKCKSKPEVTFLLIILNVLCDCTNEKRKFPLSTSLREPEKNTLRLLSENYILRKWCPGQSAKIKLCCPFSYGTCWKISKNPGKWLHSFVLVLKRHFVKIFEAAINVLWRKFLKLDSRTTTLWQQQQKYNSRNGISNMNNICYTNTLRTESPSIFLDK